MANTLQFDLVSPERSLASLEVTEVQIPGADGDMTAMADHAPTITTLRPGLLKAIGPSGTETYAVTGGFAEISAAGTTVLAERAYAADAEARAALEAHLEEARAKAAEAAGEQKDAADKMVADLAKLLEDMA